jgi:hypothetical protein
MDDSVKCVSPTAIALSSTRAFGELEYYTGCMWGNIGNY